MPPSGDPDANADDVGLGLVPQSKSWDAIWLQRGMTEFLENDIPTALSISIFHVVCTIPSVLVCVDANELDGWESFLPIPPRLLSQYPGIHLHLLELLLGEESDFVNVVLVPSPSLEIAQAWRSLKSLSDEENLKGIGLSSMEYQLAKVGYPPHLHSQGCLFQDLPLGTLEHRLISLQFTTRRNPPRTFA